MNDYNKNDIYSNQRNISSIYDYKKLKFSIKLLSL